MAGIALTLFSMRAEARRTPKPPNSGGLHCSGTATLNGLFCGNQLRESSPAYSDQETLAAVLSIGFWFRIPDFSLFSPGSKKQWESCQDRDNERNAIGHPGRPAGSECEKNAEERKYEDPDNAHNLEPSYL